MRAVVVDYGMGNLGSLLALLDRLGHEATVWRAGPPPARLDLLILPGVGSMAVAYQQLVARELLDPLGALYRQGVPTLGICLGLQLFFEASEEGNGRGLGWIPGRVVALKARRTPHMGWNTVRTRPHPLFAGLRPDAAFYFVHSYRVDPRDAQVVLGDTEYEGEWFPSVVSAPPLVGVQFHPELSGPVGRRWLENFWREVG
ncbi:MAG: imidazole glycerol phosphate synthase subunit HisH [Firmicutes bacterium]|nr:imidazole glycerol phosphate synthase subunit HisH [Alicyclobacillaceae bacterium]MCL6496587.1 imidazole glycerol phosphate synthase subunit HisH [Bacillota bacterium]